MHGCIVNCSVDNFIYAMESYKSLFVYKHAVFNTSMDIPLITIHNFVYLQNETRSSTNALENVIIIIAIITFLAVITSTKIAILKYF